jgi:putative chitinase
VTPELLAQAVGRPYERARLWSDHVNAAFQYAELTTRWHRAAFLAQVGHESGGFRWTREIWGPTTAQSRYEGRADLGNTESGDGYRYRGRGLIQITGRHNYTELTRRLSGMAAPDFVRYPEALESPRWAALSAADYWAGNNLNRFITRKGVRFKALTRAINGGLNGYDDRLRRFERAYAALGE